MRNQSTVRSGVFTPEEVSAINRAYEKALAALGQDTPHGELRAGLGMHMIDIARGGELDEERLCARAVEAVRKSEGGRIVYAGF